MNIEAMRAFIRVADYKSITKAAGVLHVPQQTVSSMIATIENELEVMLFQRHKKERVLTEEGALFYDYCVQFLRELNWLEKELNHEDDEKKIKTLKIGAQNSLAESLLPPWMGVVIKEKPEFDFSVSIADAADIIMEVERGLLDFGVIVRFKRGEDVYPPLPNEIVFKPLMVGKLYFWINISNSLSSYKSLRMKMLEGELIAQESRNDTQIMKYILEESFNVNARLRQVSNTPILIELVKNNMVIATDIETKDGGLRLSQAFENSSNVVSVPVHKKDQYQILVGYIILQRCLQNNELGEVLSFFI